MGRDRVFNGPRYPSAICFPATVSWLVRQASASCVPRYGLIFTAKDIVKSYSKKGVVCSKSSVIVLLESRTSPSTASPRSRSVVASGTYTMAPYQCMLRAGIHARDGGDCSRSLALSQEDSTNKVQPLPCMCLSIHLEHPLARHQCPGRGWTPGSARCLGDRNHRDRASSELLS